MGADLARVMELLMLVDDEATNGMLGNSRLSLMYIKSICAEAKEILQSRVTVGDMENI
ncbi:MAG: hypothetical protein SPE30_07730 [Candidatus Treponema excrementipullorum]|nr:hypothetical protein [Candidatus Treponema excrementipullorum]